MVVLDHGIDLYLVGNVIKILEYFDLELNLEDLFKRFLEDAHDPFSLVVLAKFAFLYLLLFSKYREGISSQLDLGTFIFGALLFLVVNYLTDTHLEVNDFV